MNRNEKPTKMILFYFSLLVIIGVIGTYFRSFLQKI